MAVSGQKSSGESTEVEGAPRSHTIHQPALTGSDRFLEIAGKIVGVVVEHRVPVLVTVVGTFAIALGVASWQSHQESRNEDGAEAIYRALYKLPGREDPLNSMGISLDDIPRGDEELSTRKAQYKDAAAKLETLSQEYTGLVSGTLASLERATLLEKAGDVEGATQAFLAAAQKAESPILRFRSLNGLGAILRSQGKYDEAIQQFQSISRGLTGFWKLQGMLEEGRTLEVAGRQSEAVSVYEDTLKAFPGSEQTREVEERLAAIKSGTAAGASQAPAPEMPSQAAPSETGNGE